MFKAIKKLLVNFFKDEEGFLGLATAGLGLLGGIAGAGKDTQTTSINLAGATGLNKAARTSVDQSFADLEQILRGIGSQGDITAARTSQLNLADLLKQMQETGGLPGQQDIGQARSIADLLFQGQRERLSQGFDDQRTEFARNAALTGRGLNDPILQNKLAQQQIRQERLLSADQGAAAQQLALSLPGQRLGFAQQRAGVLGGLAEQFLGARQSLLSTGSNLLQQERQFRLQRSGQKSESGGGFKGFVSGALGGATAGMKLGQGFSGGRSNVTSQQFGQNVGNSLNQISSNFQMPNFSTNQAPTSQLDFLNPQNTRLAFNF